MKEKLDDTFYPKDRAEWRKWLEENHKTKKHVWLIKYHKKSGKPSIAYADSVKEALCFGWIDSIAKSHTEDSSKQKFTPRRPKSVWSKVNKTYIEELTEQKLMTEAGLKVIQVAKENKSWESLDKAEALEFPSDFLEALEKTPKAKENFDKFPRSYKKNSLAHIYGAKRPETRQKRIDQIVELAAKNERR